MLFPYGHCPQGKGGVKACQDGLGHFFPTLLGGVRACQDGLGYFLDALASLELKLSVSQ